jgi:hypothetical protein
MVYTCQERVDTPVMEAVRIACELPTESRLLCKLLRTSKQGTMHMPGHAKGGTICRLMCR